ncbi:MAG: SCP2 sterol-binding domain-containing protein [Anaerolineales bacterium]|nr:SCP2 sterol-binding domain-containing protein [Chloroflexota bacterium]MBL6980248.1 SCP2 sterol-binding domain-containing protein [Anaerolineales bacterium]
MAYLFPSAEWLQALEEKLNSDEQYAQIARKWEGDLMFNIEPEGAFTAPMKLYLDLWHGECRRTFVVDEAHESELSPAFVLSAPYNNFTRIITGDLDPMQAMITRKLRVKGSMTYMMRNVPVVLDFVRCAQEVDTELTE